MNIPTYLILLAMLSPVLCKAQFIEVTAELELTQRGLGPKSTLRTVRCVVGTNSWQIDGDNITNGKTTYWFIDSQVIEYSVTKEAEVDPRLKFGGGAPSPIGSEMKRITQSVDGNPGRPVGARDLLSHPGRVAWLAFCSGPCLKREGREVFPPSDQWKFHVSSPFIERTVVFEDSLGLPRKMTIYTTNSQPVVQYSVTASTNVLGWQIPLEFYLAQYQPAELPDSRTFNTNAWQLHMVTKGKVTSVAVGSEPHVPAKLWGGN